jgi:hypothetical protein
LLLLSRPAPETLSANVDGLKAILETLASLSEKVSLAEEKVQDADVWSLNIVNVPLTMHLFQKGDVVGLVLLQRAVLDDTLALMAGAASKPAIVDGDRFKEALAAVPSPEDQIVYFDMRQMMDALSCCVDMLTAMGTQPTTTNPAEPQPPNDAMQAQRLIKKILDETNVLEYGITTTETKGLQQFAHSVHKMRADYMQRALGRILMNPKPVERFDRFIPVEATGFSIGRNSRRKWRSTWTKTCLAGSAARP